MSLRMTSHYVDLAGNPVLEGFLAARTFDGGVGRVVHHDGRTALISKTGEQLSPPELDFILPFSEDIAVTNVGGSRSSGALRGGQWQLMDRQGRLLGRPVVAESMLDVADGHASFVADKRWGFVNARGEVVIEPRFKFLSRHREGLAVAATDAGDVYLDHRGNVAIAGPFEEATDFEGGVARVKQDGRWGVIDRAGTAVHAATYEKIGAPCDGVAWATGDGGVSILTPRGVLATGLADAKSPQGHVVPVLRGEVWSLLHMDGQSHGEFEGLSSLSEGLAMAKHNGLWGFVDAHGQVRVPMQFDDALSFKNGFGAGHSEGGWQVVSARGAVGPMHERVGEGSEGLCAVKDGGLWGYARDDGSMAISPRFTQAGRFGDGIAPVRIPSGRPAAALDSRNTIPHVLPEGGLLHPVFAGSANDSRIGAIMGFSRRLTGPELEFVKETLGAWAAEVGPEWGWKDVAPSWLSIQFRCVDEPILRLTALIEQLQTVVPFAEIVFSRWEHPEGDTVAGPVPDPASLAVDHSGYFGTFDEYWDAAWSQTGPVPKSESAPNLKGGFFNRQDKIVMEQREMPIWYPDVRVCFGALSGSGEEYLPDDQRTTLLNQALQGALDARFERVWSLGNAQRPRPTVGTRAGEPGIERMTYGGRTGYSFAVDSSTLLHWHAPSVCRYREPELLDAIRGVIHEAGLAPMLMWRRFQRQIPMMPMGTPTVVVFNLWER